MKNTHIKSLTDHEHQLLAQWLDNNKISVIPVGVKALTRKGNRKDASSNV